MSGINLFAIYPNLQSAERTISRLLAAGYSPDQLGVATSAIYGEPAREARSDSTNLELNIYVAIFRQMVGHWGSSNQAHIVGIGRVVTLGAFHRMLGHVDTFEDSLNAIGVPKKSMELILESLRQGDVLVSVYTSEDNIDNASQVLCEYRPIDVESRARQWRMRGWRGFDAMSDPYSVEEIIRKKRQYSPPRTDNAEECVNRVLQFYHGAKSRES